MIWKQMAIVLDDKRNEIKENDIPDLLNRYHNLAMNLIEQEQKRVS